MRRERRRIKIKGHITYADREKEKDMVWEKEN